MKSSLHINLKILSIDENNKDVQEIKKEISRTLHPTEFIHVSNKSDFINALLSNEWDVILVDYHLSEMYQSEALKLCKKLCFGTPVIYVSDALGEATAVELLKAGATDYVLKDNLAKLSFAIQRAIKEAIKEREHAQMMHELRVKDHAIEQAATGIIISKYVEGSLIQMYANKAAKSITGFLDEELIGEKSTLLDGPQTDKLELQKIRKSMERGQVYKGELIQYKKNRRPFWANMTISPVFDENGIKSQFVTVIQDITEQKKMEQEIRSKNTLFKEVQSASNIVLWEYNISKDQFTFSDNSSEILGISHLHKCNQLQFLDIFVEEDIEKIQSSMSKSILWRTKFDVDVLIKINKESYKWVRFTGYPVFNENKVSQLRGLIYDIDERKNQNLELEKKHREALQYQSMLLSTQINPHFIFNSLNAVQYYILDQNIEPAINFISDFSTLMRGVLSNSMQNFISIKSETCWLKKYLELEKTRFSDKFKYTVLIDPQIDIEETLIPTMLLQPFVENAIIHGVGPLDKGGEIIISFQQVDDRIVCSVEDNGVGRNQARILGKLRTGNEAHKSYGVSITRSKIELLNELENGIFDFQVIDKTDSEGKPAGTIIQISYPLSIS